MAALNIDVDAIPEREGGDFDPLPDMDVVAQIIETEVKANDQTGNTRCTFTWEILDGQYAKRRIWDGQNIANRNPQAAEIGQRAVKDIAAAVGHKGPVTDSAVLEFKPVLIRIRTEPARGDYPAKNKVTAYKPVGGAQPTTQAVGAASGGARPWGAGAAA